MQLFQDIQIPDDHIVATTPLSFVFVNLRPFLPNHLLVSPKRVVASVFELTEDEAADLFRCVHRVTKCLRPLYKAFTINIQDGKEAGQKVFHVHVHVVPRKRNDLDRLDDIYKPGNLDMDRSDRDYEEMKVETEMLKEFFKD